MYRLISLVLMISCLALAAVSESRKADHAAHVAALEARLAAITRQRDTCAADMYADTDEARQARLLRAARQARRDAIVVMRHLASDDRTQRPTPR